MYFKFLNEKKWKIINLWFFHLIIFYITCSIIENIIDPYTINFRETIDDEIAEIVLWSPFSGFIGHWERFPFFIVLMILLFLITLYFFKNIFKIYIFSVIFSYSILYFFSFTKDRIFYYLIPSLVITIIINYFIFNKIKKESNKE